MKIIAFKSTDKVITTDFKLGYMFGKREVSNGLMKLILSIRDNLSL